MVFCYQETTSVAAMTRFPNSLFFSFFFILITFKDEANALECHVCAGAESAPSFNAVNILETLNISSFPVRGDCKDKSSSNICTNGLFCTKQAVIYSIEYNSLSLKWTTFEKGCYVESQGSTSPSKGCTDGATTTHEGYKKTLRNCYCDKDFCNADSFITISTSISMALLAFLISS
ncbi:unnamed protein product [Auanema sp. JU1783]|nr:unnamed protein product [Auanema sp. JU1783]